MLDTRYELNVHTSGNSYSDINPTVEKLLTI